MRVFILSTGRCGSMTLIEACRHITNFSCGHESRTHLLGEARFDYPDPHIEADNRLSWLLGRLDARFGNSAAYVHLERNIEDTARSFANRYHTGIIKAYRGKGILLGLPEDSDPIAVARDYCLTVNRNIACFLKDKTHTMHFQLENARDAFAEFWQWIHAEGDFRRALAEFDVHHNEGQPSPNRRP